MMGGALGLAVLASIAASRTDALVADGESHVAALTGGYHAAFFVGAIFAVTAAALGALLLRVQTPQAAVESHEPAAEPAPCSSFSVASSGGR
jgi:hypothetical protein